MVDETRLSAILGHELRALGKHIRDVTADEPARSSEHHASLLGDPLYLTMLQTLRAMVFVVDDHGRITYASPTAQAILGRRCDTLGAGSFDWIHPEDLSVVAAFARELRAANSPLQTVWRFRHPDGSWLWLETSVARSFRVPTGAALTVVFARDVSETQQALRALSDSEERFRAMAENASDMVLEIDGEGRVLFASPHSADFYGAPPEELVGKLIVETPLWTRVPETERVKLSAGYARSFSTEGDCFECEFGYSHPDGSLHWMHSSARSYRRSDGSSRLVIVGRDVTARVQAQRRVVESERRYRLVSDAARDLISECDAEGRLIYSSPSLEGILGFKPEELEGESPFQLTHPEDYERLVSVFQHAIAKQQPAHTGAYRARHKDGSWRWLTSTGVAYPVSGGAVQYLSVTRDVTEERRAEQERKRLEADLQWRQKLESLGVMAGGIAHDFNNLLTPILGDASLALMDLAEDSPASKRLQRIQQAAHRAAALTTQMLAYAGEGPLVVEPIDLSDLVRHIMPLLESAVASRAAISTNLLEPIDTVDGDSGQLTQVILNLTSNAAEAVSEGKGVIVVRTGSLQLESELTLLGETLTPGAYVFVEVSDNGSGMDDETRSRIFDPFYTTKFTGRGLGLASSLGIVRGHGGSIETTSHPGAGSRLRALLPVSRCVTAPSPKLSTSAADWRSSGTILVVDDDEGVRALAADTLRRAGFDVLCARDGQEGVELFRERADEIRAVLLDRTMPVVSGEKAFTEMRAIRKDARVILVSGYSQERAEAHLSGAGLAAFLPKPFLPTTLLALLRSVLDE